MTRAKYPVDRNLGESLSEGRRLGFIPAGRKLGQSLTEAAADHMDVPRILECCLAARKLQADHALKDLQKALLTKRERRT